MAKKQIPGEFHWEFLEGFMMTDFGFDFWSLSFDHSEVEHDAFRLWMAGGEL